MVATSGVNAFKVGSSDVAKLYLGSSLVWQPPSSGPLAYSAEVLLDAPALYWRLDETSGTAASDLSGNARHGTYQGPTLGATSLLADGNGKSADFDGSNDWVEVAYAAWMNASTFSAELIVQLDSVSGTRMLAGRDSAQAATTHRCWSIQVVSGVLNVGYWDDVVTSSGGGNATPVTLVVGETYHIVVTFSAGTLKVYVNGVLVLTRAYAGAFKPSTVQPLELGRYNNTAGAKGFYTDGKIDEFAFYTTELSAARIKEHYRAYRNLDLNTYRGAVLYDLPYLFWRLDETSGTVAYDETRQGRAGTYFNTPTLAQPSLLPEALGTSVDLVAASAQAVFRTHEASMNFTSITVEGWFKIEGSPGAGGSHTLVAKTSIDAAASSRAWHITYDHTGQLLNWSVAYTSADRVLVQVAVPLTTMQAGAHVVATYDGLVARLYLNGVLIGSTAQVGTMRTSTYAIQFGKDSTSGSKYAMDGKIDGCAVYDYVLSAERIAAHYAAAA